DGVAEGRTAVRPRVRDHGVFGITFVRLTEGRTAVRAYENPMIDVFAVALSILAQTEHGTKDGPDDPPKVLQLPSGMGPARQMPLTVKNFVPPGVSGHPISLAIDEKGRVYAAETERYSVGVKQSRGDT